MTINLDSYLSAKKVIPYYLEKYSDREISYVINIISLATNVPIVVLYYYVGEATGFTEEIKHTIIKLKEFYKYDKIIGEDRYTLG